MELHLNMKFGYLCIKQKELSFVNKIEAQRNKSAFNLDQKRKISRNLNKLEYLTPKPVDTLETSLAEIQRMKAGINFHKQQVNLNIHL